jgi:hypothetical protein
MILYSSGIAPLSLAIASGKTATINNSLTLAGIDGTTITFQGTGTYIGRGTTDTLSNKTFDTAATGNVFKINGTQITGISGNSATAQLETGSTTTNHPAVFDSNGNTTDLRAIVTSIPSGLYAGSTDCLTAVGTFATTLSVPGTGLAIGSLIEIRAKGIYSTTTGSPLAIFQVNAGGTAAACNAPSTIALPTGITNGTWDLVCFIQINTTGGPGTAMAWGKIEFANNTSGAELLANERLFPNSATGNFTTTSTQTVSVQETAALVSGQSFTLQAFTARVIY